MASTSNSTFYLATTLDEAIAISSQVRPSSVFKTSDRLQATKIRQDDDIAFSKRAPISIPDQFQRTCKEFPNLETLRYQNADEVTWQSVTYSQYHEHVLRAAKVFIQLGLEPRNGVGIMANNSPEWFYACLGAIHANGISAGIYTTNSPDATHHVLNDSNSNIAIVDNMAQMKKIRDIRHRLPLLKAVIQTHGPYEEFVNGEDGYYRWSELMASNHDDQEPELIKRIENIRVNECCSLVYTSGTVGNPKGVMISHDNITWNSWAALHHIIPNPQYGKETIVSYLPLSHIAGQMMDIMVPITLGATIYFADKDALKGTLMKTVIAAQPTRLFGVPRVYEKIYEKLIDISAKSTGIKKALKNWSKSHTLQHWMDHINNGSSSESLQYKFARYMVMGRVKEALGFARCRSWIVAAAPMSEDIKKYFLSLDIPIMEGFGMSENTGAHSCSVFDHYNLTTVGKCPLGMETKILNKDENGHGEILMKGRHVCMGYLNEPAKVDEAIDDEGYLHSGDVGYLDENGSLYVTGRLKDLLITAGGENIPPSLIEHTILKELHVLSNAFVVGDKRKYLAVLVTLKTEVNGETGELRDELTPQTVAWVEGLGLSYTKLSEIIASGPCPKILSAIEDSIKRANQHAISNAQKVQKFALLPSDFSFFGGELGPTLKVKRNIVSKQYEETIEKLYAN